MRLNFHMEFPVEEVLNQTVELSGVGDFAIVSLPDASKRIVQFYHSKAMGKNCFIARPFNDERKEDEDMSREQHAAIIASALHSFELGEMQKVVVSRTKQLQLKKSISQWLEVFQQFCAAYPNAMVSFFKCGDDNWMGATPELLLQKRNNQYKTVSLAGTQHVGDNMLTNSITWGEKERLEQQLVTTEIATILRDQQTGEIKTSGPFTVSSGPLVHLKSEISFTTDVDIFTLINVLHPTPAVCGLPTQAAKNFISKHEPHDRKFYTGYLGVLDEKGDADFYVNLRCMCIQAKGVTLYAGGGIVQGSVAVSEWDETERKMEAVGRFL